MSESDPPELQSLDGDALALLRGGSELAQVRDDGRTRLSARVLSSIAALPGGGGGSGGPAEGGNGGAGASRAKAGLGLGTSSFVGMGLTFVLGAALGFGVRPLLPPAERMQTAGIRTMAIPEQHAVPRTMELVAPSAAPDAPAVTPSAAPSAKASPARDLSAERGMLDGARAALGRGDPLAALVAVKGHERQFPRGALAEERDALYVQALAQSGKMPEARARATKFKQTYPDSMLLPAVTAATDVGPATTPKGAP